MSKITCENYHNSYLRFEDRQAGVGLSYCPLEERYIYNTYCIDMKKVKEIFSVEHDMLEDAVDLLNQEFSTWEFVDYEKKKEGCSTCVAKR